MRLRPVDPFHCDLDAWPADVEIISSAMATARGFDAAQRRRELRRPLRVIAEFRAGGLDAPARLYSRDVGASHLGFLTETPLPLGHRGHVEFAGPDGSIVAAPCAVQRCRECVPGWFEGVLKFAGAIPSLRLR